MTSLRGHVTTGAPSPVRPPAGKASPPHRPLPFPRGGGSRGGARGCRVGERGLRGRGDKGGGVTCGGPVGDAAGSPPCPPSAGCVWEGRAGKWVSRPFCLGISSGHLWRKLRGKEDTELPKECKCFNTGEMSCASVPPKLRLAQTSTEKGLLQKK